MQSIHSVCYILENLELAASAGKRYIFLILFGPIIKSNQTFDLIIGPNKIKNTFFLPRQRAANFSSIKVSSVFDLIQSNYQNSSLSYIKFGGVVV